ncbi:MAG: hypothetical protein DRP08_05710, partial [Candidatus Aenigmatarchaeota archaeon]
MGGGEMNLARQIAILSIHDAYITEHYEKIANSFGEIFKKYGLSAIIIGGNKLNRIAATSIRKKGNFVLGIIFDENIVETHYFDFILILRKESKNNCLNTILTSCGGIIVIGNLRQLEFELPIPVYKYKNIVSIDKNCNINNSSYDLKQIPIFDSVEDGV